MKLTLYVNILVVLAIRLFLTMEYKRNRSWINYKINILQHCIYGTYDSFKSMIHSNSLLKICIAQKVISDKSCILNINYFDKSNSINNVNEMTHLCRVFTADPYNGIKITWIQSIFKGKQLNQNQLRSMGQECIAVRYTASSTVSTVLNGMIAGDKTSFDKIRYIFNINILFNLNITFNEFTLSDMCIMHHPYKFKFWTLEKEEYCNFHGETEYVLIHQNEKTGEELARKLYFCMRRPQWSIFTKHLTYIDYYICRMCLYYHTQIIFTYQIIDSNTITLQDNYILLAHGTHLDINMYFAIENKYEIPAPFSIICLDLKYVCATYIYTYDIRGDKYEFIKLWQTGVIKHMIFLLNNLNHNEVLLELKQNITRTIPFFYCTIQLRIDYVETNRTNKFNTLQFLLQKVISQKLSTMDEIISFSSATYNCKQLCQKVFVVNIQITDYAVIDVMNMTFIGWRTNLCLHGGISFYEFSDNATKYIRKNIINTYREIYNLCNNYTGKYNKSNLSFALNDRTKNLIGSYIASSHYTLIVIYYQNNDILYFCFRISKTKCRGVFGNICTAETFPFNYWKKKLHYEYPFEDNVTFPCVTVQMGSQLLFTNIYYKPFYVKAVCISKINMKQDPKWCGAYLNFSIYFKMAKFSKPKRVQSRDRIDIFFKNSLENYTTNIFKQQNQQCSENLLKKIKSGMSSKDWGRGLSIFSARGKLNFSSIDSLKTYVNLQFSTSKTHPHDSCIITTSMLSESLIVFNFTYIKCAGNMKVLKQQIPPGTVSLPTRKISVCLRDTVKGFMSNFMILKISMQGQVTGDYRIGEILVYSNLCLFSKRGTYLISKETTFRTCTESQYGKNSNWKINFGEDKLIWKANLSTNLLVYLGKIVIVDLLGKIFNIQLKTSLNVTNSNSSLNLKYDWKYNSLPTLRRKHHNQFCSTVIDRLSGKEIKVVEYFFCYFHKFKILSRDLRGDYDHPTQRTWYEANRMCRASGGSLPSFVSNQDVEDFINFLKMASWSALVTNVFIGIFQGVCLNNILCTVESCSGGSRFSVTWHQLLI